MAHLSKQDRYISAEPVIQILEKLEVSQLPTEVRTELRAMKSDLTERHGVSAMVKELRGVLKRIEELTGKSF